MIFARTVNSNRISDAIACDAQKNHENIYYKENEAEKFQFSQNINSSQFFSYCR